MNLFKRYPHLFTNGKFKAKYDNKIFEIAGLQKYKDAWTINDKTGVDFEVDTSACALIARPISDMTDEEKKELAELTLGDWKDDYRFQDLGKDFVEGFLYPSINRILKMEQ